MFKYAGHSNSLSYFKNVKMFGLGKKERAGEEITATVNVFIKDGAALVSVCGDWILANRRSPFSKIERTISSGKNPVQRLSFDASKLGAYDSALISMLFRCYAICSARGIYFDIDSLPKGPRALLKLAVAVPEAQASQKNSSRNLFAKIGTLAIDTLDTFRAQTEFVGEVALAFINALRGKARFRISDLLLIIQRTGPEALPIVALISFLVGLILGFVGVIQLAKYGSEIFVADLVGIAMVREMSAIMVGIVMSGRTGASFAAELGSMKVNEEISAFKTFGISPVEFLVFPRIFALVLMMPLLTIFADVIGMLGGMAIGVGISDVSAAQYINRTFAALTLTQISTGFFKSFVFGIIVAGIGCQKGLECENSSSGVGQATTSSVVESITWIIVADAVFAVAFTIFDI